MRTCATHAGMWKRFWSKSSQGHSQLRDEEPIAFVDHLIIAAWLTARLDTPSLSAAERIDSPGSNARGFAGEAVVACMVAVDSQARRQLGTAWTPTAQRSDKVFTERLQVSVGLIETEMRRFRGRAF